MESFDTVVRFFQDGGSFMLPIAIVLAIGPGDCPRALFCADGC